MNNKKISTILAVLIALAGCGGGGGSSSTPAPVVTPAPVITISLSSAKVSLGKSSTITWSATNSTSCTASGAWSGSQTVSGTSTQTPTTSGQLAYTLTCTGAGGSSNQTATLIVPIPVQKSSYLNKIAAAAALGPQPVFGDNNAVAFADFFHDGTYSMVTNTLVYNNQDPTTANKFGSIQFWKKVNGAWVDQTSAILTNSTIGCLHPRKAIVADFNGDGVPDVFFSCHGFDAPPFPGEQPHMLISQTDGTYKNITLPITCFCHGASAADMNGNGYANIMVADQMVAKTPYFLINNKDGTFAQDKTRLPASLLYKKIWTAELIDFKSTGRFDAVLAGADPTGSGYEINPTIFPNDGTDNFLSTSSIQIPVTGTALSDPTVTPTTLDVIFDNGNIYLLRSTYSADEIEKISYANFNKSNIYEHSGQYSPTTGSWVDWIIPYQGKIVSLNAAYGVSVPE